MPVYNMENWRTFRYVANLEIVLQQGLSDTTPVKEVLRIKWASTLSGGVCRWSGWECYFLVSVLQIPHPPSPPRY